MTALRSRAIRALPYAVVLVIAGYLYYSATGIQYSARPGTLGPDFWPRLVLILLIAVCLLQIVKLLVAREANDVGGVLEEMVDESAREHDAVEVPAAPAQSRPWLLLGGIALTALYVGVVQKLGFFAATVPYLAAFIALGGYRRWGIVAATSVLGTLLMFFFFVKVVYISLPIGEPPFQSVTLFLMQVLGIR